jgi:hypothetical protein
MLGARRSGAWIGEDEPMSRAGTGLTAATIPLVIALSFFQEGSIGPGIVFAALTGLIVIGTFAGVLPVLNRIPVVGAPRLTIGLSTNGSPDAVIGIAASRNGERAQSVLMRVDVHNHSRADLAHTLLDFYAPAGQGLQPCDHRGEPISLQEGRSRPEPPTQGPEPMDNWHRGGLRLTGREGRHFYFRMRVDHPGDYRLKVRIRSSELYRELALDCILQVNEVIDLPMRDALSILIDKGETLRDQIPEQCKGKEARLQAGAFVMESRAAIAQLGQPAFLRRIDNAVLDYIGPKSGDDYLRALVISKIRVLYDVRGQIGAEQSQAAKPASVAPAAHELR